MYNLITSVFISLDLYKSNLVFKCKFKSHWVIYKKKFTSLMF